MTQADTGMIIGKSAAMREIDTLIQRIGPSISNVLVTGESGTGKEVVARAIHAASPRHAMPFVAINCSAIPDTLLESELFGHARGSFTGAVGRKRGLFEEADGGTLFLDEIGDMPPLLQSKLLRALQERSIRPVGANHDVPVDVRIIAATNADLRGSIRERRFREDLFYRLNVIPIHIPPLRERREDIPDLAVHLLRRHAQRNGKDIRSFAPATMHKLLNLPWEGNVRELENAIERAVVLCKTPLIEATDVPVSEFMIRSECGFCFAKAMAGLPTLEKLEQSYIQFVLERMGGRKEEAANALGISRRTLHRKEREYGA